MKLEDGNYVVGVLGAVNSRPWANDPSKFNHEIVISRPYNDGYGNPQTDVTTISIGSNDLAAVQAQVGRYQGQRVVCPCVVRLKKGETQKGPYAFIDRFFPSGGAILPLDLRTGSGSSDTTKQAS